MRHCVLGRCPGRHGLVSQSAATMGSTIIPTFRQGEGVTRGTARVWTPYHFQNNVLAFKHLEMPFNFYLKMIQWH